MTRRRFSIYLIGLVLSGTLLACQKPVVEDLNLDPLVGKATREDIRARMGSPDSVVEAQEETLYVYIIKHREKVSTFEYNPTTGRREPTTRILSQWEETVLMRFDKQGILRYWRVEKK